MKHQITLKNLEETPQLTSTLSRLIARLDREVSPFGQDEVSLHGIFEKHRTRARYRVSFTLNLPGRTMAAQEEQTSPESALKEAFRELERQLKKYKSFVRKEDIWKRSAKREQIRQVTKGHGDESGEHPLFFELVQPHLKKLHRFVLQEIEYYVSNGDLIENELSVQDVEDTVLVRAAKEFNPGTNEARLDSRLIKLAMEYLRSEVGRLRKEHRMVHLEENVKDTPPEDYVVTLGDEILDFYQPDQNLHVEDVMPDPSSPIPEQVIGRREFQRSIDQMLAQLPHAWRNAILLRYVHGFSIKEVAEITASSEDTVKRQLEMARVFLGQKLRESGYARSG
jgi:ribosomal subunit interface protein